MNGRFNRFKASDLYGTSVLSSAIAADFFFTDFGPTLPPTPPTPSFTYAASRTTSSGTTFTPTLPSGTGRVFVPVSCPSNTALTTASTDWRKYKVVPNGTGLQCTWFISKVSAGSSPGALVVTSAASTLFSTVAMRSDILRTRMIVGVSAIGTAANANPGLVDQLNNRPTRFVEVLTLNGTGVASAASTNYSNLTTQAGFTAGASTCVADRSKTGQIEDPGAWTHSSAAYITQTIAFVDGGTDWDDEWKDAAQNLAANGRNIAVNFWGDSLTSGATAGSGGMANDEHATARPAVFAAGLTVGPGSSQTFLGVGGGNVTSGQLNAYDNRRTAGTNWDHSRGLSINSLGGGFLTCSSGTADLAFVPGGSWNRHRVLNAQFLTSAQYTSRVDSGAAKTLIMDASPSGVSWSPPIVGSGTTINIGSTGVGGYIMAAEAYTHGSPQISVFNAGWFGSNSAQNAEVVNFYSPPYVASALDAKLTVICIGSNDPGTGVTTDQTEYNTQTMALVGLRTGSVVIESPPYASGGTEAAQDVAFDILEGVADALCVGFFRISNETGWTSYATALANGFMTGPADNHPTVAGYADWAARELAYMDPGPAVVSVTVADATHGHSATSPSLAASSDVSVDSATHGHGATSPTLGAVSPVSPADAAHGHTASSPTLSASGSAPSVTADDAVHAHSATSPALSTATSASANNATHAHSAGSPALATNTSAAPDNAAHAHSATSPTLAAKFTVTSANGAHAHTVSSPTLAFATTISVASALHDHTATSPTLAANDNAVHPDNATHAHWATSPVLVSTPLDVPGYTDPLAIEGGGSVVRGAISGGGSVVAGSISSTGRVVAGFLRGRP